MSSVREQIMASLKATLQTVSGAQAVYRSRVVALQAAETPAILLEPITDAPALVNIGTYDWTLRFHASVVVRGLSDADSAADPIVVDLHQKIMQKNDWPVQIINLAPESVQWQFPSEAQQPGKPALTVVCVFELQYRTTADTIST